MWCVSYSRPAYWRSIGRTRNKIDKRSPAIAGLCVIRQLWVIRNLLNKSKDFYWASFCLISCWKRKASIGNATHYLVFINNIKINVLLEAITASCFVINKRKRDFIIYVSSSQELCYWCFKLSGSMECKFSNGKRQRTGKRIPVYLHQ